MNYYEIYKNHRDLQDRIQELELQVLQLKAIIEDLKRQLRDMETLKYPSKWEPVR